MWPKKRKSSKKDQPSSSRSQTQSSPQHTNTPPPLPPLHFHEPTHQKYYDELIQRKLLPSKHYCQQATRALGIDEDIWFLFDNLKLGAFVANQFLTYAEPTFEFLASFESTPVGNHDYHITFQLFNKKHTLNLKTLNQHLSFHPSGKCFFPADEYTTTYNLPTWWKCITNEDNYRFAWSSASQIIHLALRILHRLLGYSVFSKKELGKLSSEELQVLFLATLKNEGKKLNFGHYFVKQCKDIKVGTKTGTIHMGAMVTRLAIKLGHEAELASCTVVGSPASIHLNLKEMCTATFIAPSGRDGVYHLLVSRRPYCFLPDRPRTSITRGGVDNVWFFKKDRRVVQAHLDARRMSIDRDSDDDDDDDDVDSGGEDSDDDDDVGGEEEEREHREERREEEGGPSTSKGQRRQRRQQQQEADNLARQMQRTTLGTPSQQETQDGMFLQIQQLYDASVARGIVTPPVNYPYWPPQHGPIPSWGGDNVPTYPYWQGPQGPTRHFPDDSGNYDYRVPGGSDFRGDPNYPYIDPTHPAPLYSASTTQYLEPWQEDNFAGHYGWPPGYTGGWDPYAPPPSQSEWRERTDLRSWNPPGPFDGDAGPSGS